MEDLVALILVNIATPGAVAGFIVALARGSGPAGILADVLVGAAGGVGGGIAAVRLFEKSPIVASPGGAWLIWAVAAVAGIVLIAVVRSIVRGLREAARPAA